MPVYEIWPENWEELGFNFNRDFIQEDEPLPPGWIYISADMINKFRKNLSDYVEAEEKKEAERERKRKEKLLKEVEAYYRSCIRPLAKMLNSDSIEEQDKALKEILYDSMFLQKETRPIYRKVLIEEVGYISEEIENLFKDKAYVKGEYLK